MSKEDKMIVELKRIRELLEPKPTPKPTPPPKGLWNEFINFLSKYKVMGLAVAFIIGLYLGNFVQALVTDLIMPIIGLLIPGLENLATMTINVGSQIFLIGDFLTVLLTFIIVAFVIFLVVKITKKWGIQ